MAVTLYGIPNCDTVKQARSWLAAAQIEVAFHDFKKAGLTSAIIAEWLQTVDWQLLVNKRGTTWRKLPPTEQLAVLDTASALQCMLKSPSVIKRPVLVLGSGEILVGYSAEKYQAAFAAN